MTFWLHRTAHLLAETGHNSGRTYAGAGAHASHSRAVRSGLCAHREHFRQDRLDAVAGVVVHELGHRPGIGPM